MTMDVSPEARRNWDGQGADEIYDVVRRSEGDHEQGEQRER